LKKARRIIHQ
jgi:hypothetical protein